MEERKRAEGEKKRREEEERRKQVEIEKQKQSETERQEMGENKEDPAEEAEWRKQAEVRICEQRVGEQMTQAAQVESSKQVTRDFARAALAYWQSRGTARFNWLYVDVGPIGTNRYVSISCFPGRSSTDLL